MFGFLNLNKIKYQTSREAVNLVQSIVKPSKVGHAGTLDPLATGVLVVAVGPATRLVQHVQGLSKTYLAEFRLGFESDTEDVAGQIVEIPAAPVIQESEMKRVLPEFVGELPQTPPRFSALKIQGERAYRLARQGKTVELKPRIIEIFSLELVWFKYPEFCLKIHCGSGTYVRSLGRDIGTRLGSGAIMTGLVRTRIGNFLLEESLASDAIDQDVIDRNLLLPQDHLNELKQVRVSDEQLLPFANGCAWTPDHPIHEEQIAAVDQSNRLLAILKKRSEQQFTPNVNFANYWIERQTGL